MAKKEHKMQIKATPKIFIYKEGKVPNVDEPDEIKEFPTREIEISGDKGEEVLGGNGYGDDERW